jgi:hypothetical protein
MECEDHQTQGFLRLRSNISNLLTALEGSPHTKMSKPDANDSMRIRQKNEEQARLLGPQGVSTQALGFQDGPQYIWE